MNGESEPLVSSDRHTQAPHTNAIKLERVHGLWRFIRHVDGPQVLI